MFKKGLFSFVMALTLIFVLMGCKGNKTTTTKIGVQPDVTSVEITNTERTLGLGTFEITTRALPAEAVQQTRLTLVGNPVGVSITGTTLTISVNAVDQSKFTIRVTSLYDPSITSTAEFTVNNPPVASIEIHTEDELQAIGQDQTSLGKKYVLMNNIVLTKPFEPIGTADVENEDGSMTLGVYFTGVFDGNGYTISGIDINKENGFTVGFFNQIGQTGIVKNTTFEGSVYARGWSGGIAGINGGTIENCVSNINVEVAGGSAGAFVSVNRGTIRNSYAIGLVMSGTANDLPRSRGLVAANEGELDHVFGDYETLGTQNYIAFDLQQNSNYMLSTANMKTASTFNDWDTDTWFISDGFYPLLKHDGFVEPSQPDPSISITNTDTAIDIESLADMTYQVNASILNDNSYTLHYRLETAITGVTIDEITGLMTFTTDVVNMSTIKVNVKLVEDETITASKEFTLIYNPVPTTEVVEIKTEQELANLATSTNDETLSKTYLLMNNIELTAWFNVAIGSEDHPFTGTFDGQGYTISGFKGGDMQHNFGFFGFIGDTGVVKNLGLVGAGRDADLYVGANTAVLASTNRGLIENVSTNVTILSTGNWDSGFVATNYGTIRNCYSLSKVMKGDDLTTHGIGFVIDNQGIIENSFVDQELTGVVSFLSVADETWDAYLLTTAKMKTASTYAAWDVNVWNIVDGEYPTLKYVEYIPTITITTEQDLVNLATTTNDETLGLNYVLGNDIELTAWFNVAIGSEDHPFTGTFDGQGYTISGFKGGDMQHNFGFFGFIGDTGVVKNLGLVGAGRDADLYVGANTAVLASTNRGLIENVFTNATILSTGNWDSGFVATNYGTIRNCYSLSKVMKADDLTTHGIGFVIDNQGTIENSFVDQELTGVVSFLSVADETWDAYLLTTAKMKTASTYAAWDVNVWNIVDGEYPTLK